MIVSYNTLTVKTCNAKNRLVQFLKQKYSFYFFKWCSLLECQISGTSVQQHFQVQGSCGCLHHRIRGQNGHQTNPLPFVPCSINLLKRGGWKNAVICSPESQKMGKSHQLLFRCCICLPPSWKSFFSPALWKPWQHFSHRFSSVKKFQILFWNISFFNPTRYFTL